MTDAPLTPSKLWKHMNADQRQRAARAFWLDDDAADDQIQAVLIIANAKKFRPKFVLALDVDRKIRHLATINNVPDALAARILVVYHLTDHREMMGAFLDALGIEHENGLIASDDVKPEPDKVGPAAAVLYEKYPLVDVTLYLDTLLCQDPETWGALADVERKS
jgi:hypothetical protein